MSLENKPNGNRNSLRVKDQSKFASGEWPTDNTPTPPEILNTLREAQISDLFDKNITWNSNSNHSPRIQVHNFLGLSTAQEHINTENRDSDIERIHSWTVIYG